MKLHQLRSFDAIVRNDCNITRAAEMLHATQPGVTKHLQSLEAELGVALFVRNKRRLLGLTDAGKAILPIAVQAVEVLENLQRTARYFAVHRPEGLTVATSPTPARVFFPALIQQFAQRCPQIRVRVISGSVHQSIEAVVRAEADFCLCSAPRTAQHDLKFHPCFEHRWLLIAPPDHELLRQKKLTLKAIARHGLITYHEGYASRSVIEEAFAGVGLTPDIVLDTTDSDIMRRYVASGLGVAIVGGSTFEMTGNDGLVGLDLDGLIPTVRMHLGIRRGARLRAEVIAFLSLCAPHIRDW